MNIEILIIVTILIASLLSYTFIQNVMKAKRKNNVTLNQLYTFCNYLNSQKSFTFTYKAYIKGEEKHLKICYEEKCYIIPTTSITIFWRTQGLKKEYNISYNKLWQIYGNLSTIGLKSGIRIRKIQKVIKIEITNLDGKKVNTTNIVVIDTHILKILKVATHGKIFYDNTKIYEWNGYIKIIIVEHKISV